jgi:hypothetical protein
MDPNMNNKNILTWAALMILTTMSYLFSERNGGSTVLAIILLFTFVKIALVAWQYMELKKAHKAWMLILGFVIASYGIIIFAING